MNNKILILSVLIALCGVLCCGCVNAVELDNGTCAEPLSIDEKASTEPLSVDNEVSAEHLSVDNEVSAEHLSIDEKASTEPLSVDNEVSVQPLSIDEKASTEPLIVDKGATSTLKTTQYKTVTYKEKVLSHYKKYTKTFKCVYDGKSVKAVKKYFKQRMEYGDDECCRYSVGKVVRAWYYDNKAYSWKIMKIKKISKKKYSAQAGGKIAKYKLVVKLYYKKPVYKTVTRTKQVSVY